MARSCRRSARPPLLGIKAEPRTAPAYYVDLPDAIDAVVVFRRPNDIPAHVDDILACRPSIVWMQLGIRHDEVARRLSDAGISVVQNRCLMVDLQANGI
jgi:predicted CoA-binding protein